MPATEKKRELADFFKPYARARLFPAAGNIVPQKRPSPSPETENTPPPRPAKDLPSETPRKVRTKKDIQTPKQPSYSPVSLPRSGNLPIRSPHPKSSLKAALVYKDARLFERRSSPLGSLSQGKTPSPEVRQDNFNFASVSQAPVSTQSVVRQGKLVAVRGSDEDDSDSLASLDEIFGTKRDDDTTSASSPPEVDDITLESERRKVLSAFTFGRSEPLIGKGKLRALNAKEKGNKIDISRFINDHLDDEEEQEKIQRFKDQYDKSVKTLESGKQDEVDAKLLASLVQKAGGDEDDIARLMSAVSRTEALSSTKTFSFFGPSGPRDLEAHPRKEIDFPHAPHLSGLFKHYDDDARARAFSSGYMSELASAGHLREEVLSWTFNSLWGEKDDHLRQAYLECLEKGASWWARTNITAYNVQAMFEELGADPTSLKDSIQPSYQPLRQKTNLGPKYLVTVLSLYHAICQHMDFVALASLASIVCRITLDEGVMSSAAMSAKVEALLQTLWDTIYTPLTYNRNSSLISYHLHQPPATFESS
jgi:hypothetical protein